MILPARRIALFVAAASALVATAVPATAVTRVNDDVGSDRLPTGHCLGANSRDFYVELRSPSGRFTLDLFPSQLDIKNHLTTPRGAGSGYNVWEQLPLRGRGHRSTLCMQADGNLVLRVDGHPSWSTATRGTGHHNYTRLLDDGHLVVRTAAGRTVWNSHTTAVLLRGGDRLDSGRALVNRTYPGGHTRLQMQRGGDLVLWRGAHRVWHTDTHRPGSVLFVSSTGRLTIRTPAHHTVWRSPAVGRNAVMTVAQKGRLTLQDLYHSSRCWVRPAGSGDCSAG